MIVGAAGSFEPLLKVMVLDIGNGKMRPGFEGDADSPIAWRSGGADPRRRPVPIKAPKPVNSGPRPANREVVEVSRLGTFS